MNKSLFRLPVCLTFATLLLEICGRAAIGDAPKLVSHSERRTGTTMTLKATWIPNTTPGNTTRPQFYYKLPDGTTVPVDANLPVIPVAPKTGADSQLVYAIITGLPKSTAFPWRLFSGGNTDDNQETTDSLDPVTGQPKGGYTDGPLADFVTADLLPEIQNVQVSNITSTGAAFAVTFVPNDPLNANSVIVEYGADMGYGQMAASKSVTTSGPDEPFQPFTLNFTVTGLDPGKTYHFRAKATNTDGNQPGTDANFTTLAAPTVTTPTSASVSASSATLGGNVTADGGAALSARGVVLAPTATNPDPQLGGSGVIVVTAAAATTGVFTVNAGSLAASTGYTFRAYATNANGTSYTPPQNFTTLSNAAPANDNFDDAMVLTGTSGTAATVNNFKATKETGETLPQSTDHSVWYEWTAPFAGVAVFDTFGSGFDTVLGVMKGSGLDNLTTVVSNDDYLKGESRVPFTTTAGAVYRIFAGGFVANTGNIVLNYSMIPKPRIPAGKYAGVLTSTLGGQLGNGGLTITIDAAQSFTAKVALGSKTVTFRGYFDLSGEGRAVDASVIYRLLINFDAAGTLSATLTAGDRNGTASGATAQTFGTKNNVPFAAIRRYTLLIGDGTEPGYSYATATVAKTGAVKVTGVLRDGTKFSLGSNLSVNSTDPALLNFAGYNKTHGGKGFAQVAATFASDGTGGTGNGVIFRPSGLRGPTITVTGAAFYDDTTATIIPYTPPAKGQWVSAGFANTFGAGTLGIDDPAALASTNAFTLSTSGSATSSAIGFKLKLDPKTGLYLGTRGIFKIPFGGAFVAQDETGYGFTFNPFDGHRAYIVPGQ